MNPSCPECGELLTLVAIGDVIWDYGPTPPSAMRSYLLRYGEDAPVWECFGFGCFWSPARLKPAS